MHDKGRDEKEDLRLALVEIANDLHGEFEVALLLADDRCGRVLARRGEVDAVGRALDLHLALGAAADGTNLMAERRTGPARTTLAAEATEHWPPL